MITVGTKEYISVIEGTALAIVLQRFGSPNLSPPVLSGGQVVQSTADRAGRGWVIQIFVRRWRVLYSLVGTTDYLYIEMRKRNPVVFLQHYF